MSHCLPSHNPDNVIRLGTNEVTASIDYVIETMRNIQYIDMPKWRENDTLEI